MTRYKKFSSWWPKTWIIWVAVQLFSTFCPLQQPNKNVGGGLVWGSCKWLTLDFLYIRDVPQWSTSGGETFFNTCTHVHQRDGIVFPAGVDCRWLYFEHYRPHSVECSGCGDFSLHACQSKLSPIYKYPYLIPYYHNFHFLQKQVRNGKNIFIQNFIFNVL